MPINYEVEAAGRAVDESYPTTSSFAKKLC